MKPGVGIMALLSKSKGPAKPMLGGDEEAPVSESSPDMPDDAASGLRSLCKSTVEAIMAGDEEAACEALMGAIKASQ